MERLGHRIGWDGRGDEIGWEGCPAFGLLLAVSPMPMTVGLWHRRAGTGMAALQGLGAVSGTGGKRGTALTPPQYLGKLKITEHRRGVRSEEEG